MEVENNSGSTITCSGDYHRDEHVRPPGFRFHPTDEELVGFYLKRKVEKRQISIEIIKQADIYKYDPWDLPKSGNVGDKEWYFFCKRGRKYKNSIRPNRVTGSGFWKATGIDKPICSSEKDSRGCVIGLKKSLVYYRGFAGKGTKTDWMMHEFRLPPAGHGKTTKHCSMDDCDQNPSADQEAEVWTLCRILKRNICNKKCILDWHDLAARQSTIGMIPDSESKTCSLENTSYNICFDSTNIPTGDQKPFKGFGYDQNSIAIIRHFPVGQCFGSSTISTSQGQPEGSLFSSSICSDMNELSRPGDWEDLRSIVDCASGNVANPFYYYKVDE